MIGDDKSHLRCRVSRSAREIGRKCSGCPIFRNDTSPGHLGPEAQRVAQSIGRIQRERGEKRIVFEPLRFGIGRIDREKGEESLYRSPFSDSFLRCSEFIEQENRSISELAVTNRFFQGKCVPRSM